MTRNNVVKRVSKKWFLITFPYEYSYHFKWLGRPIIQYPQDIIAIQEIIWKTKPDLIIETGIARGGSLIFLASILDLIGKGKVVGIDVNLKTNNRTALKKHTLHKRIIIINGSSTSPKVFNKIRTIAKNKKRIMVILDSDHRNDHVLKELELYSSLVTKGNYLLALDTIIQDLPSNFFKHEKWKKGDNPKTAVTTFLQRNNRFKIDYDIEQKLLITVAPSGYLKCIRNE